MILSLFSRRSRQAETTPQPFAGPGFPLDAEPLAPRVAIGGVGGSGTRVLITILQMAGLHIGDDLNEANDNLWFTLLFKEPGILDLDDETFDLRLRLFIAANTGGMPLDTATAEYLESLCHIPRPDAARPQHTREWLQARAASLKKAAGGPPRGAVWGWKEPNTHVCLDRLMVRLPGLKYIHLARNGLDMAYSANRAQLAFWGARFLGRQVSDTPRDALAYWCAVHKRIFRLAGRMDDRFLFVRFEDLCAAPKREIARILAFVGLEVGEERLAEMAAMVRPPASIGRWREHGAGEFDAADVEYVRQLGFSVEEEDESGTTPRSLETLLDGVEGWLPLPEARYLSERARECGGDVVEIGSYRGRSTIALAHGLALAGVEGAQVYAIDPHAPAQGVHGGAFGPRDRKAFFRNLLAADLVERVALINLPSQAAVRAWDREIALLFIDGDHRYEQVRHDAFAWTPFLRDGGLAIFDDADDPQSGPGRVLEELARTGNFRLAGGAGRLRALVKTGGAG